MRGCAYEKCWTSTGVSQEKKGSIGRRKGMKVARMLEGREGMGGDERGKEDGWDGMGMRWDRRLRRALLDCTAWDGTSRLDGSSTLVTNTVTLSRPSRPCISLSSSLIPPSRSQIDILFSSSTCHSITLIKIYNKSSTTVLHRTPACSTTPLSIAHTFFTSSFASSRSSAVNLSSCSNRPYESESPFFTLVTYVSFSRARSD